MTSSTEAAVKWRPNVRRKVSATVSKTTTTTTTTTTTPAKLGLNRPSFSKKLPFCTYSRTNISFLIALTVSYGFLLFALNLALNMKTTSFLVVAASNNLANNKAVSSYLLYSSSSSSSSSISGKKLSLDALLKDTNHSHASDTVSLELANEVWAKMHKQAENYAHDRVELLKPNLEQLLANAGISSACKIAMLNTVERLAKLDDWAMRMYNSFGNFLPAGFFEGTHTSMGSYQQCVSVQQNEWIGRPQYCTFKFQPVIPRRPRYHNILATIDNLANFTSENDIFHSLAKKAHYFYYTKLRLATCLPTKCEKIDLERLGEQIAVNTYLQFQGVQCLEKSDGFKPDRAQQFALLMLILMASVSLLGTLVHLFDVRSHLENAGRKCRLHHLHNLDHLDHHHLDHHHHHHLHNNHHQVVDLKGISCNGKDAGALDQAIALQQQKLLSSSSSSCVKQQRQPILPQPAIQANAVLSVTSERLLKIVNVLMHFSVIRNGRKLFDTSTSRRQRGQSRAASLVPGMREAVALDDTSSASSAHSGDTAPNQSANIGAANIGPNGVSGTTTSATGNNSSSSTASVASSEHTSAIHSSGSDSSSVDGRSNDISCVHGLRFWTISWIILGHTMQYTEWAAFGRAYQIEQNITSFLLHPLLNATYSVDTFFLISGLLTTYVTWSITRGQIWRFNKFAFLISRYLRLMPQVLIVILLFIAFPLIGDGPYWRGIVQKESDNCKRNWWVSALFLQSFYRSDQICNLVTWWLSIEMFYHLISIFVIIALLHSAKKGVLAALVIGGSLTSVSYYLHYVNAYPPNMLPTLLQRFEMWDSMVLKYFWTPYPHAPSYFVGLMLGYVLYNRSINQLSKKQVKLGWLTFAVCYLAILFGTYFWNKDAPYSRLVSTTYYTSSQIIWSFATAWAILACALGHGGWLNDFLSSPVFVPLGRATYMTYLSHMLIVMAYPAKQNLLIEPSYVVFLYIFISNLCLSYMLGITLTLVYESPILHLQKLLVTGMAQKFNGEEPSTSKLARQRRKNASGKQTEKGTSGDNEAVRVALYAQPETPPPIKVVDDDETNAVQQMPPAN